jgi:hypothetical protein
VPPHPERGGDHPPPRFFFSITTTMNLPSVLSKTVIDEIKSPADTHAVRVILHDVHSSVPYRLACNLRQYVFDKCGIAGRHILDIPVSLWMAGAETAPFRDNTSISEDFRTAKHCRHSIQIVQIGASAPSADFLSPLRELLGTLGAPSCVNHALDLIAAQDHGALLSMVAQFAAQHRASAEAPAEVATEQEGQPQAEAAEPPADAPPRAESAAARRMREKRARDKAAKLQPA